MGECKEVVNESEIIETTESENPGSTPKTPTGPDKPDKNPPQNIPPEPTPDKVNQNQTKTGIDEAIESNDPDTIYNYLKDNLENLMNSTDEELKNKEKSAEDKLKELNSKDKLRQFIKDQIYFALQQNELAVTDLSNDVQSKYEELDNSTDDNISDPRPEALEDIGSKALNKIITSLEQALQKKEKDKIKASEQVLKSFMASKLDYRKQAVSAYELTHQGKIDQLLSQAQQQLSQNNNNDGKDNSFFKINNP